MRPDLLPAIFQLYDCVIVESFGAGGIPQSLMEGFAKGLGRYEDTHKVLILTTQVTTRAATWASMRWAAGSRTGLPSWKPTT